MKIKSIKAVAVDLRPNPTTAPRIPRQQVPDWVSPMMGYSEFSKSDWGAPWGRTACVVTAEDGTWGLGITTNSAPVNSIINDQFAPILVGQNCMATEKAWDMMQRATTAYGNVGLASYAISAVDNALWDLKASCSAGPYMNCWAVHRRTESSATPATLTPRMAWRTASSGSWNWDSRQ